MEILFTLVGGEYSKLILAKPEDLLFVDLTLLEVNYADFSKKGFHELSRNPEELKVLIWASTIIFKILQQEQGGAQLKHDIFIEILAGFIDYNIVMLFDYCGPVRYANTNFTLINSFRFYFERSIRSQYGRTFDRKYFPPSQGHFQRHIFLVQEIWENTQIRITDIRNEPHLEFNAQILSEGFDYFLVVLHF